MFKIMFGVAGGILLAGLIGFGIEAWFAMSLMKAGTELMNNNIKQMQQMQPQKTSTLNLGQYNPTIIKPVTPIRIPPADYVKENSKNAVIQAKQETENFDKQYKKPEECYNTTETKMRIKCANEYMRARKAFEMGRGQ